MSQFLNKTVVITGIGCSGIGFSVAKQMLQQGAKNVAVLDTVNTNNTADRLQADHKNQNIIYIKINISQEDHVKHAFKEIMTKFQSIDIVLANAGILNERDYELAIQVNLLGALDTVFNAVDVMSKANGRKGGIIACTALDAGLERGIKPIFSVPTYSATNSAIISLTRSLSNDFHFDKHGIKFITFCPSSTITNFIKDFSSVLADTNIVSASRSVTGKRSAVADTAAARCFLEKLAHSENGSNWIVENGENKRMKLNLFCKSE